MEKEKKLYLNSGPDDPNTNWLQAVHRERLARETKKKRKRNPKVDRPK